MLLHLAWRDFLGSKLLWGLSAAAVALGVSTVIAAEVVRSAILNAMHGSPEVHTIVGGLTDQLGSNLTVMGVAISLASGFVVFNAFGMSVARRRVRIAILRTAGMSARQVLRLTVLESLLTGALGVGLGWAAGPLVGALAIEGLKSVTAEGMFLFVIGPPGWQTVLLAGVLGLLVCIGAALGPASAAARVPPLAARRPPEAGGPQRAAGRSALVGLGLILVLLVYLRLAPPAEWLRPPWDGRLALLFAAMWLAGTMLLASDLAVSAGRILRRPLQGLLGASGLLVADNLQRERRRVGLTIAALAISLALVVGVMGFTRFTTGTLMGPMLNRAGARHAWSLASFNPLGGMAEYAGLDSLTLRPEQVEAVRTAVEGSAQVIEFGFATVPELSYFGENYFTFVMDPAGARLAGEWLFSFNQGNWESALELMEGGCGALVMPTIAAELGAQVGEAIQVTGPRGREPCRLAGVGAAFGAGSIIGTTDRARFGAARPFTLFVQPLPGADRIEIDQALTAAADQSGIVVNSMQAMTQAQLDLLDQVPIVLNGMAVLAVIASALGVVNTLTVGVVERRREFGLYRAVGATRRQLLTAVTGEACLMSTLAGGLGVLGGAGITIVVATVYGGASWGLLDLDYWAEAARILPPALELGLIGWAATPLIGALAGLLPARALLRRRRLVEELHAERH